MAYVGEPPTSVQPGYTFKCQVSSFVQGSGAMQIGDVYPEDSPTGTLPYSPGVWPFTFNLCALPPQSKLFNTILK